MTSNPPAHDEPTDEFRLVADNNDSVTVFGIRRSIADATDYDDGNWLEAVVELRVGQFSARFPLTIRADEVLGFFREAKQLHQQLSGTATFVTMEEQLYLHLEGDGIGHIAVTGNAQDVAGTGNRLDFKMYLDQTYLWSLVSDLERVTEAHSVRGV
jgi:hypothetical protein